LIVVLDFDGTLIKENSSRLFEECLIKRIKNPILKQFLILILFSRLSLFVDAVLAMISRMINTYDLRRKIIVESVCKWIGIQEVKECIKLTAKSLNANDRLFRIATLYQDKLLILSNGLDLIIHEFLKVRGLNVKAIFADSLIINENCVQILHRIGIKGKKMILRNLSYHHEIIYITDDLKEYNMLKKSVKKCKVLLVQSLERS
jgi:hypothetical protein